MPNEITKKALIDHLHKSLLNLYEYRRKTVSELSMQIKHLNEKMVVTLDSFKKLIQKHQVMISQVNLIEVVSKQNNDRISKILSLKTKESIEKPEGFFEIFDESEFFIDDYGKICKNGSNDKTSQIIFFRDNTMKIVKTDLENDYLSTEFDALLDNPKSMYTSMCLIPKNSVFCYGNHPTLSHTAFIIDSNSNIIQVPDAPIALLISGSIYYNNHIYIFGGYNGSGPANNAFTYDLVNKRWENLKPLPAPSRVLNCTSGKNKILLSGYDHSKIYCYDIAQNNYIELYSAQANCHKIVCGNKQNCYVIEIAGNIYESNKDWKIWRVIGSSGIENSTPIGFKAIWRNKIYFVLNNYNLYEFCLKEKKIKKIRTI